MSWHTAKKRFQKDLDKLPRRLYDKLLADYNRHSLPTFENQQRVVPAHLRKTRLEHIGFASGDFAYIAEGEHKGKIATVFEYSAELDSVLLSDVTTKKIVPKSMWVENQSTHLMDYPDPVPVKNVKLAAKDKDENGNVYYVVADEVIYKDKYYDERYRRWLPKRFVKHHNNIEIPWPSPPQDPKDGDLLTPQQAVHEKTWELQSISKSPLPKGLLGELRNPYSKHKKRTLTELEARKLNAPEMPLSEEQRIYLAKKAQQPPKELRRLTPEIQDFIGEKIASHLAGITNENLLKHLDALTHAKVPDFEKTMKKIEEAERK